MATLKEVMAMTCPICKEKVPPHSYRYHECKDVDAQEECCAEETGLTNREEEDITK